jgi:hypothetical protein
MNWRFAIAVLLAPSATHAQIALENSSGYNCTIKDLRTLQNDGGTQPRSTAGISSFIVDRASGPWGFKFSGLEASSFGPRFQSAVLQGAVR